MAIISHIGRNTDHGHYVCHVKKDGQWAFFNDEKVRSHSTYTSVYHSLLFYLILFRSISFYSVLFYSILFYSILFYSILFYSILFHSIIFYSILFHSIIFYSILFHSISSIVGYSIHLTLFCSLTTGLHLIWCLFDSSDSRLLGPRSLLWT